MVQALASQTIQSMTVKKKSATVLRPLSMGAATLDFAVSALPRLDGLATQVALNAGIFSFTYGQDEHTLAAATNVYAATNAAATLVEAELCPLVITHPQC